MSKSAVGWTFELSVTGMHCAGCAARLEGALKRVPGVSEAAVNFATGRAFVREREGATLGRRGVLEAIESAGFGVAMEGSGGSGEGVVCDGLGEFGVEKARRAWGWAMAGFGPLAVFAMGAHVGVFGHGPQSWWLLALQAGVSAAVVFWAGRGILRSAWGSLRRGGADMDTLVGLGAVLAWMGSVAEGLAGRAGHTGSYFEAAAGIVTFSLLGRWLEARARRVAGDALRGLAELLPERVRVEAEEGAVAEDRALAEVKPGMVVWVAPGERVPVDGVVLSGQTTVDSSWVTGESVPVGCGPGDRVIGGTVNGAGSLRVRVEAAGREAYVRQVVEIVREAQSRKAPVQRLAVRVAEDFAKGVLVLALATFAAWSVWGTGPEALWLAMWRGLTVLVVACPCALGLATPVAVWVGSGTAARRGILFRSGAALEALSKVDAVLLDKTGTLTSGQLEVVEWWERESLGRRVLGWVASAEAQSVHPLGAAVVRWAREVGVRLEGGAVATELVAGRGLKARVGSVDLLVGNSELMREQGVELPPGGERDLGERLWVAVDGVFAGWFRVADRLRPEATAVVQELRRLGLRVVLLSGDREETARRVAAEVGIEEVQAGVRPEGKREVVLALQRLGLKVAMVGDGVNDAPALAQADLGVAMGGGTAVARQTADVTLACGHLGGLMEALALSKATRRVIRQNLAFAFGYNLLALPMAAGVTAAWGWVPGPMLASAAMAFSSVSVVLNALRLRRHRGWPGR
jgi:Cu+-exporting ATPase